MVSKKAFRRNFSSSILMRLDLCGDPGRMNKQKCCCDFLHMRVKRNNGENNLGEEFMREA
jgi:hypothetical protein